MVRNRRKPRNKYPDVGRPPKPFRCAHFWVFEEPDGPSVIGTCLKCGETQEVISFWEKRESPDNRELDWDALALRRQQQRRGSSYDYGGMAP